MAASILRELYFGSLRAEECHLLALGFRIKVAVPRLLLANDKCICTETANNLEHFCYLQ